MGYFPGLITDKYLPQRLNSHQRQIPRGTLISSARWPIEPMARWIQWVYHRETSARTGHWLTVIICRWFRWFWLSHNRPRWWVLPMYRSSS